MKCPVIDCPLGLVQVDGLHLSPTCPAHGAPDRTAADVADEFNAERYGVPAPEFSAVAEPCPRRQCRGRSKHPRLAHWFGWVRR